MVPNKLNPCRGVRQQVFQLDSLQMTCPSMTAQLDFEWVVLDLNLTKPSTQIMHVALENVSMDFVLGLIGHLTSIQKDRAVDNLGTLKF